MNFFKYSMVMLCVMMAWEGKGAASTEFLNVFGALQCVRKIPAAAFSGVDSVFSADPLLGDPLNKKDLKAFLIRQEEQKLENNDPANGSLIRHKRATRVEQEKVSVGFQIREEDLLATLSSYSLRLREEEQKLENNDPASNPLIHPGKATRVEQESGSVGFQRKRRIKDKYCDFCNVKFSYWKANGTHRSAEKGCPLTALYKKWAV